MQGITTVNRRITYGRAANVVGSNCLRSISKCWMSNPSRSHASVIGYQAARLYAERFDSHYGSGLIPKSAPMVEEIAEFWGRHFLGRGWRRKVEA